MSVGRRGLKGEYLLVHIFHYTIAIALLVVTVAYLRHGIILITTATVNSIVTTFVFNRKKNFAILVATISIAVCTACSVIVASTHGISRLWTAQLQPKV